MAYRICPECGAALDPGERCDCAVDQESQANGKSAEKTGGYDSMSQQKQAPESAETYRHYIHRFIDEISDANTLWTIYSIVLHRWKATRKGD